MIFLNNTFRAGVCETDVSCSNLICIIVFCFFQIGNVCYSQNDSTDFTNYYYEVGVLIGDESLSPLTKLEMLDSIEIKYGKLLPNEIKYKGILFDKLSISDSVHLYLEKATRLGVNITEEFLSEKYEFCRLSLDEDCFFNTAHRSQLNLLETVHEFDQVIRVNNIYSYLPEEKRVFLDSLNTAVILDHDLLKFSNTGYRQIIAVWTLYHSDIYEQDSLKITQYLLELVSKGELHPYYAAHLIDYWSEIYHGFQVYGTLGFIDGKLFQFDIPFLHGDVEKINSLRKKIGLVNIMRSINSFECDSFSEPIQNTK
jgi:hypothetical protein